MKLDPPRTAFVAIDLQKGIAGMPTVPHPPRDVIKNAKAMADALRDKGGFVVWVRVAMSKDGKDRLELPCDAPWKGGPMPPDWSELVPELGVQPSDHVVTKKQWGTFYGTDLELQLRRRGLDTIVLCGIATCFGVESTARDAYERGFCQILVEDAMSCMTAEGHEHAIKRVFPRMGLVRSTSDVLAGLR